MVSLSTDVGASSSGEVDRERNVAAESEVASNFERALGDAVQDGTGISVDLDGEVRTPVQDVGERHAALEEDRAGSTAGVDVEAWEDSWEGCLEGHTAANIGLEVSVDVDEETCEDGIDVGLGDCESQRTSWQGRRESSESRAVGW